MQSDDLTNAWQGQSANLPVPPVEEIRKKAATLQRQIWRRNKREYLTAVLLVGFFGYRACVERSAAMRLGHALMIVGVLYAMWQLHRRARAGSTPGELGWKSCVEFHRSELERQRDALASVWRWYLGPLAPGLLTIAAATTVAGFRRSATIGMATLAFPVVVGLVFWGVARLNRNAAAELQRQIDAM